MSVADLMEDRVSLDGVLMKCNQDPEKARTDADCLKARIAIERLAMDVDPSEQAKRDAEFERRREKWRLAQERQRQELENAAKVDAYALPLAPMDPAANTAAAGTAPPSGTTASP